MQIRDMTRADLAQVLAIERRSFADAWIPEMFVAEMQGPVSYAVVLADGEVVAGYATWRVILDEAHLMNIAVHPDLRGRRLGRMLLDHITRHSRDLGAEYLFLEVRGSNTVAHGMYVAAGFKEAGRRIRYYRNGEDALLMTLRFPPPKPQPGKGDGT